MPRMTMLKASFSVQRLLAFLLVLGVAQVALPQDAASSSRPTPSVPPKRNNLPKDIEEVLWWLPEQTEAIVVSRGNVPVMELRSTKPPTPEPSGPSWIPTREFEYGYPTHEYEYQDLVAKSCIEPLAFPYGLFPGDLQPMMVRSFYGPKTASLFVKAAWWENDQTRASCDIVLFRDYTADAISRALAAFPHVPRDLDGVPVLEMNLTTAESSRAHERYLGRPLGADWRYVAAPRPNVYVATTNRELMRVIVERMRRPGKNRALPSDLPEWQQLDPSAPAWGIRHYRRAIADRDITSMAKRDDNAKGLVFFGGNKPRPFICLRYVSTSEDAGSRFLRMEAEWLPPRGSGTISMRRINADCVESRLRINVPAEELARDKDRTSLSVQTSFMWINAMYLPLLGISYEGREPLM